MKRSSLSASLLALLLALLPGCTGLPDGIEPVDGFELQRYLGTWYEIARLDHSFERGLSNVTAHYRLRPDGGVQVINRGYDVRKDNWREARGKAYLVGDPDVGRLKVSFFGPFYGGYNIIALDRRDYSYALVCGPSRGYLWILARTPQLRPAVLQDLLAKARQLGFATDELIYPEHDRVSHEVNLFNEKGPAAASRSHPCSAPSRAVESFQIRGTNRSLCLLREIRKKADSPRRMASSSQIGQSRGG